MPIDINHDIIDLKALCQVIKQNKRKFIILQIAVVAAVCLYVFTTPRNYRSYIEIAPELSTDQNNNVVNILRLISQTGFSNKEIDAIFPLMYPNIMFSDGFVANLLNTPVTTLDGTVSTTYGDYLKNHTRASLLQQPARLLRKLFGNKTTDTKPYEKNAGQTVVSLTKEQQSLVKRIQNNINCMVDRKMGIISIFVQDQDPQVSVIITDTITRRLKQFVIDYRTNKARTDYKFCTNMIAKARKDYNDARQRLLDFTGSHYYTDRPDLELKKTSLEQEVSNRRAIMEAAEIRLYTTQAKIQENTPVFSVIKKPYLPHEPYSPKIGMTLVLSLLVANVLMLGYIFRKRLINLLD